MKGRWTLPLLLAITFAWSAPFEQHRRILLPGKFFFNPIATHEETIVVGYMSKIKPTPQEIETEKKRVQAIIEGGIKKEYGSWENYEKQMREAAHEAASREKKEAPRWARRLIPPELVEEVTPLLLKGALTFAMAHPELQSTPVGNVGETGVVIINEKRSLHSLRVGLNAPITSIDISPNGKWAVAIADMSYEDSQGRAHIVGKICLIDIAKGKLLHTSIFANALDEARFIDNHTIAFMIQNPDHWENKGLRFIDIGRWRLEKRVITFDFGNYAANINGITKHPLAFHVWPRFHLLGLLDTSNLALYDTKRFDHIRTIPKVGVWLAPAHTHPWVLSLSGPLWDLDSGKRLLTLQTPMKMGFASALFSPDDQWIFARPYLGAALHKYDPYTGQSVANAGGFRAPIDRLRMDPTGDYIVGARANDAFVTYHGAVRRHKIDLVVFDSVSLMVLQRIESPPGNTFIDYRITPRCIVTGTYDTIEIYLKKGA